MKAIRTTLGMCMCMRWWLPEALDSSATQYEPWKVNVPMLEGPYLLG